MTGRRLTNRPAGVTVCRRALCAAAKSKSPNSVRSGCKWCIHIAPSASLRRLQPLQGENKSQEIRSRGVNIASHTPPRTHGAWGPGGSSPPMGCTPVWRERGEPFKPFAYVLYTIRLNVAGAAYRINRSPTSW
eukprot:857053-Prymnesium_polylepis.1